MLYCDVYGIHRRDGVLFFNELYAEMNNSMEQVMEMTAELSVLAVFMCFSFFCSVSVVFSVCFVLFSEDGVGDRDDSRTECCCTAIVDIWKTSEWESGVLFDCE